MFCAKFGLNWPSGSEESFGELSIYFYTTSLSSPLGKKRSSPFGLTWISLPLWHGCFVPSLEWNWLSGIWEDFKVVNKILLYRYYLPFKNSVTLHWTNLNYALCPVWLIDLGLCNAMDNGKILIRKTAWTWAFGWGR